MQTKARMRDHHRTDRMTKKKKNSASSVDKHVE